MRYIEPSRPIQAIRPAMEMKEAADIQSAPVAMPFRTGWICLAAT